MNGIKNTNEQFITPNFGRIYICIDISRKIQKNEIHRFKPEILGNSYWKIRFRNNNSFEIIVAYNFFHAFLLRDYSRYYLPFFVNSCNHTIGMESICCSFFHLFRANYAVDWLRVCILYMFAVKKRRQHNNSVFWWIAIVIFNHKTCIALTYAYIHKPTFKTTINCDYSKMWCTFFIIKKKKWKFFQNNIHQLGWN